MSNSNAQNSAHGSKRSIINTRKRAIPQQNRDFLIKQKVRKETNEN